MNNRLLSMFTLMLTFTLFLGCKEEQVGQNATIKNSENVVDIASEAVAKVAEEVVDPILEVSDVVEDSVDSDEGMNPEDINVEFLYNNWEFVTDLDNDNIDLFRFNRNNTLNYHSINRFGNYDNIALWKWEIIENKIYYHNNDFTTCYLIMDVSKNLLKLKLLFYGSTIVADKIVDTYQIYTEEYDFDGEYSIIHE